MNQKDIFGKSLPRFTVLWLFQPSGAKAAFDYIRNTGLCAILLFSGFVLERAVFESPLYEISNSESYSALCDFASADPEELMEEALLEEVIGISVGFSGGHTIEKRIDIRKYNHDEARLVVGAIVYKQRIEISKNYLYHAAALFVRIGACIMVFVNFVAWLRTALREMQPVLSGSMLMKVCKFGDRVGAAILVVFLTAPIMLSMYTSRDELFGEAEKSVEQLYEYADLLGENDFVSLEDLHRDCKVWVPWMRVLTKR